MKIKFEKLPRVVFGNLISEKEAVQVKQEQLQKLKEVLININKGINHLRSVELKTPLLGKVKKIQNHIENLKDDVEKEHTRSFKAHIKTIFGIFF